MPRAARLALAVALLASACGGEAATDGSQGPAPTDVAAALGVLEPGVDVAEIQDAFRPGQDGEGLEVGYVVRTDEAGFAEVRWVEGALTRLDVNTSYTLVALSTEAAGVDVEGQLETGRTWHRVQPAAADSYEVTTPVGTAAVRGTGFAISCLKECTFALVEGQLAISTTLDIEVDLRAGEQVTVEPDGTPGPIEPLDEADPWIARNLDLDDEAGFLAPPEPEPGGGRDEEAQARLDGEYSQNPTITEDSGGGLVGQPFGEGTYAYTPDCDTGPCGGTWDLGDPNQLQTFIWTGDAYAAVFTDFEAFDTTLCPGVSGPTRVIAQTTTFTPTATEVIDGQPVVTSYAIEWEATYTATPDAVAAGCVPEVQTIQVSGTGTRVA